MTLNEEQKKGIGGIFWLVGFVVFIILFTYSSLNLKNIDYGYQKQKLMLEEKNLQEEIDKLKAQRAMLLNLKRVETIVIEKLGYQYPKRCQIINAVSAEKKNENK